MEGVRRATVGQLGAVEIKAQSIRTRCEVDQRLEVRLANGPECWREAIVEAAYGDSPIKGAV